MGDEPNQGGDPNKDITRENLLKGVDPGDYDTATSAAVKNWFFSLKDLFGRTAGRVVLDLNVAPRNGMFTVRDTGNIGNEAGKVKLFTEKLALMKVDIAFVQETRLLSTFENAQAGDYHVIASPALSTTGAHGGLAVLVRADSQLVILSHTLVSHRVLSVALQVINKPCRLVCTHGPIAEAPEAEHEEFAEHVRLALQDLPKNSLVFTGADLNARLKGLEEQFSCVGDVAA
eukprot:4668656-Amphidinium_carterae.1